MASTRECSEASVRTLELSGAQPIPVKRERVTKHQAKTLDPHQITNITDLIEPQTVVPHEITDITDITDIAVFIETRAGSWSVDRGACIQAFFSKLSRGRLSDKHIA